MTAAPSKSDLEPVADARRSLAAAAVASVGAHARRTKLLAAIAEDKAALAALETKGRDADVEALLGTRGTDVPDAGSRKEITSLKSRIAAAPVALAQLQADVDNAERTQLAAAEALRQTIGRLILQRKDTARRSLMTELGELTPRFAELLALDEFYLRRVGPVTDALKLAGSTQLWSSSLAVQRLINSTVPSIRPGEFSPEKIADSVSVALSTLVDELMEK